MTAARTHLCHELAEVLRRAAEAQRAGTLRDEVLRPSLRAVCEEARQSDALIEHLLILCKESWKTLPEALRLPRDDGDEALARVITLCIDEFYRAGTDDRPQRPPHH